MISGSRERAKGTPDHRGHQPSGVKSPCPGP